MSLATYERIRRDPDIQRAAQWASVPTAVVYDEVSAKGEPHRRRVLWGGYRHDDVQIGSAEDQRLEFDRGTSLGGLATLLKLRNDLLTRWALWEAGPAIAIPASSHVHISWSTRQFTMGELLDNIHWDWPDPKPTVIHSIDDFRARFAPQ